MIGRGIDIPQASQGTPPISNRQYRTSPREHSIALNSISRDLETFSFPSRQWRQLLVSIQSGMMVPVSASTLKRTGVESNLWRLIMEHHLRAVVAPGGLVTALLHLEIHLQLPRFWGRGSSAIKLDLRAGVELASRCRRRCVSTSVLGTVRYFASKSLPQCIATDLIVSELRGLWPLSPERHSHRP
jgi:hypothetical protein